MSNREFSQFPPESVGQLAKREEQEMAEQKAREKLRIFVAGISERLKSEGVPLEDNCRIDMQAFRNVYSEREIEADNKLVADYEKDWYKDLSPKEVKQKKIRNEGEQLEMLKTSVFDKFLNKDFIAARTSSYDDIKNKIDNVILEKETGASICAFDEVGDTTGVIYEKKTEEVLERNRKEEGGKLKYGLKLEDGKLALGPVHNLPIFYLALPKRLIQQGIQAMDPSFQGKSENDRNLFGYFISSIDQQIKRLRLERHLNPELTARLEHFEELLARIREKEKH